MDKEYIALLGVFGGWLLTTITTSVQGMNASRRSLGKALGWLIYWHFEMVLLYGAIELRKSLKESLKDFEANRQRSWEKYTLNDPVFHDNLLRAIERASEISPLDGYALHEIYQKYKFMKQIKLNNSLFDHKYYIKQLSLLEAGFIAYHKQLEELLLSLAWKHNLLTWVRLKSRFRTHRIKIGETLGGDLGIESLELLRKTLEEHQNEKDIKSGNVKS